MLAFKDGLELAVLPPGDGTVQARIRFLALSVMRQLRGYQKRGAAAGSDSSSTTSRRVDVSLSNPRMMTALNYIMPIGRMRDRFPNYFGRQYHPQGVLVPKAVGAARTYVISSLGNADQYMSSGAHAVHGPGGFAADFLGTRRGVRARDGEFLVQCWGEGGCLCFEACYDLREITSEDAQEWANVMQRLLG